MEHESIPFASIYPHVFSENGKQQLFLFKRGVCLGKLQSQAKAFKMIPTKRERATRGGAIPQTEEINSRQICPDTFESRQMRFQTNSRKIGATKICFQTNLISRQIRLIQKSAPDDGQAEPASG